MQELKKEDLTMIEENKEDFRDSVIERKNLVNQFKLRDVEKHLSHLEKAKKEAEATAGVARATVDNVARNHSFVTDLSKKERHHVWLYKQNEIIFEEKTNDVKVLNEEIEKFKKYLDVIYDKFGFVKSDVTEKDNGKEDNEEGTPGGGGSDSE